MLYVCQSNLFKNVRSFSLWLTLRPKVQRKNVTSRCSVRKKPSAKDTQLNLLHACRDLRKDGPRAVGKSEVVEHQTNVVGRISILRSTVYARGFVVITFIFVILPKTSSIFNLNEGQVQFF